MLIQVARPRLRPSGGKVLRVRQGHPLTYNLRALIVTGGIYGLGRDLVTGAEFTGTSSPTVGMTKEGPAVDISGSAYISAPKQPIWNVLGSITVAFQGLIRTIHSGGAIICNVPAGGNGIENTPFSLEYTNANDAGFVWVRSSSFSNTSIWKAPDNSIPDAVPFNMSVSQGNDKSIPSSFWINGNQVTTASIWNNGTGLATGNSDPLVIGRRPDGAYQLNGLISIILVAEEEWGQKENNKWNSSPYAVLEEAPIRSFGNILRLPVSFMQSGTVYSESFTETVALDFTATNAATFANSVSESVATNFTVGNTVTFSNAFSESVATNFAVTNVASFVNAFAESVALGSSFTNAMTFPQSFAESVALGSSFANAAIFPQSFADTVTLDMTVSGGVVIPLSASDNVNLGFSASSGFLFSEVMLSEVTLDVSFVSRADYLVDFDTTTLLGFSVSDSVIVVVTTPSLMPAPQGGPRINVDFIVDNLDIQVDMLMEDVDFMAGFRVRRVKETVNQFGRNDFSYTEFEGTGSFQPATGLVYAQFPEMTRASGDMELYTRTRLTQAAPGYQGDIVFFEGQTYIVKAVIPWRGYGQGYEVALLGLYNLLGPKTTNIGGPPGVAGVG